MAGSSPAMTKASMTTHIHTEADLDRGIMALIALDLRFAPVFERTGLPPLRRREAGFAGLAQIIMGQQLSTASADAIHGRLVAIADPFDHHAILRARKDRLLRVGLSNAKVKALKEIAKSIEAKHIDLAALADMPADDAHNALTALHGIGPWTADLYLLACLGHADAWPAGGAARLRPPEAADHEGDGPACRQVAAVPRGRGTAVVELLSRYEKTRRRAQRARDKA